MQRQNDDSSWGHGHCDCCSSTCNVSVSTFLQLPSFPASRPCGDILPRSACMHARTPHASSLLSPPSCRPSPSTELPCIFSLLALIDGLGDVLISAVIVAPWRPAAAPTPRRPIHVHTRNGPRSPLIQRLQLLLLVPTPATRTAITTAAASPRRIAARPRILLFHPNMITTRSA